MATTTQMHVVKNQLVDALALRAGLAGVQIASAYLGKDSAPENIQFLSPDRSDQDWAAIGKLSRDEKLTIQGVVWVIQPGAGETIIRSVRARAMALFAEIEAYIRSDPTLGGTVKQVNATEYSSEEGASPNGRYCAIEFFIHTMARLTS